MTLRTNFASALSCHLNFVFKTHLRKYVLPCYWYGSTKHFGTFIPGFSCGVALKIELETGGTSHKSVWFPVET